MADENITSNFVALLDSCSKNHRESTNRPKKSRWRSKRERKKYGENKKKNLIRDSMRKTEEDRDKSNKKQNSTSSKNSERPRSSNNPAFKRHSEFDSKIPSKKFCGEDNKITNHEWLKNLLNEDPVCMLTTLANRNSRFANILTDRPLKPELLTLVIKLLRKVSESDIDQLKRQVLLDTVKLEFLIEIKQYAVQLAVEYNCDLHPLKTFFDDVLTLFESIIILFPSMANGSLKSVLVALKLSMDCVREQLDSSVVESYFEQLKSITDHVNFSVERNNVENKASSSAKQPNVPESFRDLKETLTLEDFTYVKPFLRQNIVKGSYSNVEHYLDVQFRLLREDFIAPLRTGIFEHIESVCTPSIKKKKSNVHIYSKVKFTMTFSSRNNFGYLVDFNCDGKLSCDKMKWEYNKRFLFGSLVLLSNDLFKTFFVATVMEREINKLQKGLICLSFVAGTAVPENLFDQDVFFVMAESQVYFEAYRHVLSALKQMNEKNFPMKKYIVDVSTASSPPLYLNEKSVYCISGSEVQVMNCDSWPAPEKLGLNPSQFQAFKFALTNDFAVIQGPPGTGKTFLALKIAEVLLDNSVCYNSPIVVICYTNHALDQFLEGILKYTKNLVRIGSQSKNEVLQEYNIDVLRKKKSKEQNLFHSELFYMLIHEKNILKDSIKDTQEGIDKLSSEKRILDFWLLKDFIIPYHYEELMQPKPSKEVDWLLWNDRLDTSRERKNKPHIVETASADNQVACIKQVVPDQSKTECKDESCLGFKKNNGEKIKLAVLTTLLNECAEDDFLEKKLFNNGVAIESIFNVPQVTFSFDVEDVRQEVENLRMQLVDCNLPKYNRERILLERGITEASKEYNFLIEFVLKKFDQFQDFKLTPDELKSFENKKSVWEMKLNERWKYYFSWIQKFICQLKQRIQALTERYKMTLLKLQELRQLNDLAFVRKAQIVGLTTSGAAMRRVLLENLKTKIVIVEEAAEVLEAHIVTSLTKSVEHVILIGDHKQLKPKPAVHQLARKYHLDVSLFERMFNNGMHCSVLAEQHRMRPEIASLICPAIYPSLSNHSSTTNRPKISGVDKFVFFLTHDHPEEQVQESSSRQNKFEADFLLSLCHYLLQQGYQPQEITILATYLGQVFYLKKEKRRLSNVMPEWKDVRITPVDNFQGEENRIILLSLVRSNKEGKIGFLNSENRVCVALSRAREGLYIVGNLDQMVAGSAIWPRISQQLQSMNAVGSRLLLRCEKHPSQVTEVCQAEDFKQVPYGGCTQLCQTDLDCGHICPRVCHITDKDHSLFKCWEPCNRKPCDFSHDCPLLCHEPCQPCSVPVKRELTCGHTASLPCNADPSCYKCLITVDAKLPECGHTIQKPCHQELTECLCSSRCENRLPCGHACKWKCHVHDDPEHFTYQCKKMCLRPKSAVGICQKNHLCRQPCHEECQPCEVEILSKLPCGHNTLVICSEDIQKFPCRQSCTKTLSCGHVCRLRCRDPCDPTKCAFKVMKPRSCGHVVKVACGRAAESVSCRGPCTKLLTCGHPCTACCRDDCSTAVCYQLVQSTVASACGHEPPKIPCYLNQSGLVPRSEMLLQWCQAPCRDQLLCGHTCFGTCGSCLQGRLHIPCHQPCNIQLFCGHRCEEKCGVMCSPCKKDCAKSCAHSKCAKKCSLPCTPCTKRTKWTCRHVTCETPCEGDLVTLVCRQPCSHQLVCGHLCIGFCGQRHPSVCRVCNSNHPVIAAHPTSSFILLEDCDHIVPAEELDQLVSAVSRGSFVKLLQCPQCQTPIVNTQSYRGLVSVFRQQLFRMSVAVQMDLYRMKNTNSCHAGLLESRPTESESLNNLMAECAKALTDFSPGLLLACLLVPLALASAYRQKQSESKRGIEEFHMLEHLANALKLRLCQISYTDLLQVELEVARVIRVLNSPVPSDRLPTPNWNDISKYSWERDQMLSEAYNLPPLPRFSATLLTLGAARRWHKCNKHHLYVSDNGEPCVTCQFEEEQKRQGLSVNCKSVGSKQVQSAVVVESPPTINERVPKNSSQTSTKRRKFKSGNNRNKRQRQRY